MSIAGPKMASTIILAITITLFSFAGVCAVILFSQHSQSMPTLITREQAISTSVSAYQRSPMNLTQLYSNMTIDAKLYAPHYWHVVINNYSYYVNATTGQLFGADLSSGSIA